MAVEVKEGEVFGAWLVQKKLSYGQKYECLCTSCGQTKKNIRVYDLIKGKTRMCRACSVGATKASHGMSDTPEYNIWMHMLQRCHNPQSKDYKNYGGRGIEVCDMWKEDFSAFLMSVGRRPGPEYTIERLDYNKGYEPGNVVWATRQDQVLNKRDNVNLTIDGVTKAVSQWALEGPVTSFTIYKRIKRGWLDKYGAKYTVFTPSSKESEEKSCLEEDNQ